MKTWQWIALSVLTLFFIVLGGFREIVFVNINEQLAFNDGLIQEYRVLDSFHFLKDMDSSELNSGKWFLTILFTLVYLLLSWVCLRYILMDARGSTWLLVFCAAAMLVAGIAFLLGRWTGHSVLGYTISRVIMGGLQSPFPLMLMIPARLLAKR